MSGDGDVGRASSLPGEVVGAGEAGRAQPPAADGEPEMTPERRAAIERAVAMMRDAPDMGGNGRRFTRDEMYER
jgi:hypothetical protein